jgi:glycosyltransferase involved in cell wall biosynthesis
MVMSIREAQASPFDVVAPHGEVYEPNKPILTVIIDCYYRLDLVKQSIQSVLDQDYHNVELILVDNGAHQDVAEHLVRIHEQRANVSLIRFATNQFAWDDTDKAAAVCWNAALLHARGDYVVHLAYDDMFSVNFATRMVRLFVENPACVTAGPMPVSIDATGKINQAMTSGNTRGRYTDGIKLARDLIAGSPNKLFAAPGEILVIKKELLLQYGGFDRMTDLSQILKFSILGESGFDPEAALYWRHHDGQLNKLAKKRGVIWYSIGEHAWRTSGIVSLWKERFDANTVKALLAYKRQRNTTNALGAISENIGQKNFPGVALGLANIAREHPALLARGLYTVAKDIAVIMRRRIRRRLRRNG